MKRFLPFLSIAFLAAACNTSPKESAPAAAVQPAAPAYNPDTIGLAEFQEWKVQNEMTDADEYQKPQAQYAAATPKVKVVKKAAAPARQAAKPAVYEPAPAPLPKSPAPSVGSGSGEEVAVSTEANEAKAEEKEGWSKAAKGAVIGGAGGAAVGAVIMKKNRALGAAIGGVLGGAGGYVIGRKMDKKDGRY